jgi:hypothetical protein
MGVRAQNALWNPILADIVVDFSLCGLLEKRTTKIHKHHLPEFELIGISAAFGVLTE